MSATLYAFHRRFSTEHLGEAEFLLQMATQRDTHAAQPIRTPGKE